ncbi:hypothetical protein COCON_G00026440 [Conger conger]|uniref:Uncharacterized protein n=1 Tax=Conger conger TaxID=82655 RepID=A0A9Q1DY64_CONCO|nr:hypothetical protein COCON_G00026440 [Conger conger]
MEPLNNDSGYQSDTSGQAGLMGNLLALADSGGLPTVNILQAAESKPLILCGTDAMTLVANKNEYDYLKVEGVNDAPLYLSQLPSSCGHTFERMSHHIVLKTPYDGCFITRKGDKYIMPLLWWESPVNISCPVTTPFPLPPLPFPPLHLFHPPAICTPFGMNINIEGGLNAAARLNVELQGKRVPFLSSQCGYHVIGNPAQPIIHVPYRACGMKMMAGMQVLSLFSGKTEKIFTCHLYPTSTPSFYHSVVPIHGYSSPPVVHQVPPLKVPIYPSVPDPFNYEQSLYTYPQAVLSVKSWPAPTKRTPVPPGYHPYGSVNPNIHLHPSAGGSSLPGFIPPFDSALHMQQTAFPVCTPSGPIPCIFPFPFHHHRDPLSPPPNHHHNPFSPPPPHHHHDPFSPPPPHHHHDPFSPPPPHYHHDPFSSLLLLLITIMIHSLLLLLITIMIHSLLLLITIMIHSLLLLLLITIMIHSLLLLLITIMIHSLLLLITIMIHSLLLLLLITIMIHCLLITIMIHCPLFLLTSMTHCLLLLITIMIHSLLLLLITIMTHCLLLLLLIFIMIHSLFLLAIMIHCLLLLFSVMIHSLVLITVMILSPPLLLLPHSVFFLFLPPPLYHHLS